MILYLHGFASSPQSLKARQLQARMHQRGLGRHFAAPQLPVSPAAAIALAETLIARAAAPVTLVGSSLGGHYATWLAERHDLRAVVVNPAVLACLSLDRYLGTKTHYHSGESFEFTRDHMAEMAALTVPAISHPKRYWLLAEQGDEVLDYRQAVDLYRDARQTVLAGGDHSFTRWEDYLDEVIDFAALEL